MAALVTLIAAKVHLHLPLTTTDRDGDVQDLVDRSSAIVITHLKSRANPNWSVEDPLPSDGIVVPKNVEVAVLLLIGQLDQHRGDDVVPDGDWKSYLIPFRDPTLA